MFGYLKIMTARYMLEEFCRTTPSLDDPAYTYSDTCDLSTHLNDLYVAVEHLEYPKYAFRYMFAMREYIEQSRRAVVVARLYLMNNGCPVERLAEYAACIHYILTNCPQ